MNIDKKKKISKIVGLSFIGAVALYSVFIFIKTLQTSNTLINIASFVLIFLSLVAAFVYILKGYGKESQDLYKLFIYSFALSTFSIMINSLNRGISAISSVIVTGLAFILLSILLLAKNIGPKFSLCIAFSILGLNILSSIIEVILLDGTSVDLLIIVSLIAFDIIKSLVLTSIICFKYLDKNSRNTK